MNASKKPAELKTNEFFKDVIAKGGKKYKVKIKKGADVKFDDRENYDKTQVKEIDGKVVEITDANKTKIEKIDEQPDVKIEVVLDRTTWGRCLRIKKIDTKEVDDMNKTEVSVKGNLFFWPTYTLIGLGVVLLIVITGVLIWSLFKKDGDEE